MNRMRFMVTSVGKMHHGLSRESMTAGYGKDFIELTQVKANRAGLTRWPYHHPSFQSSHENGFRCRTKPGVRHRHDIVDLRVRTELLSPGRSPARSSRKRTPRRLLHTSEHVLLFFGNRA